MLRSNQSPAILIFLFFFIFICSLTHHSLAHNFERRVLKRRTLMGIKETPAGGNFTFDCSPSGPCIPCSRSEKRDQSFHCGETGYRIRLKCDSVGSGSEEVKGLKEKRTRSALESTDLLVNDGPRRRLLSDTAKSESVSGAYVTYRSCIPAVSEEKLSVLGFQKKLTMGVMFKRPV
ncbi:uncharacterized protein LOC142525233 isoform X2 [Primulina tabacum]|uniref:uncharacterized protein LOC142525233 isoform X2 n=1 Tax=Primulina tabacum TaxID=48773 RepID=UPI003F592644